MLPLRAGPGFPVGIRACGSYGFAKTSYTDVQFQKALGRSRASLWTNAGVFSAALMMSSRNAADMFEGFMKEKLGPFRQQQNAPSLELLCCQGASAVVL